jgi:metallo-beta-lactamase class B
MTSRYLLAAAFLLAAASASAQQAKVTPFPEPPSANADWEKPFPPFKIVGNFYYVGTYDLGCYIINTPEGLILINSGIGRSAPMIKASIEQLGFKYSDIKLILATHGHRDHVGGLGQIQAETGAKMAMNAADADVIASGGAKDYRGDRPQAYLPVRVDQRLKDGDKIGLGGVEITVHHNGGHTPGATSFNFVMPDGGKTYNVWIVNMNGINQGVKLLAGYERYPNIVQDFQHTFDVQKTYMPDIWVSSHAGQFNLHQVYKPGDPYNPARFGDLNAYRAKIAAAEANFKKQLAAEQAAKGQ